MNFGEVIQNWKEGVNWIDGTINPYVTRDMTGVMMNPVVHGDLLVRFTILDKTFLVNGKIVEYQRDMEYHTFCLNGTEEEKNHEVIRLQDELKAFTDAAIAERQQQIDGFRKAGDNILTTNPYSW